MHSTTCRSPSSFKEHVGTDGRKGFVCSTKLGGDWVLAESEQIAVSCTCEEVLKAYLDGKLQRRWSADKVIDVATSVHKRPKGGGEPYIRQDLVLHSQRIIRSHTGVMKHSQRITVDKIGSRNYCALLSWTQRCPARRRNLQFRRIRRAGAGRRGRQNLRGRRLRGQPPSGAQSGRVRCERHCGRHGGQGDLVACWPLSRDGRCSVARSVWPQRRPSTLGQDGAEMRERLQSAPA